MFCYVLTFKNKPSCCYVHLLVDGAYQFTLQSENQFIFLSQLLQQGLLSAGILNNKQRDTMLHITQGDADSSDLSKGPDSRKSNT